MDGMEDSSTVSKASLGGEDPGALEENHSTIDALHTEATQETSYHGEGSSKEESAKAGKDEFTVLGDLPSAEDQGKAQPHSGFSSQRSEDWDPLRSRKSS
jgi:hypothetical protein